MSLRGKGLDRNAEINSETQGILSQRLGGKKPNLPGRKSSQLSQFGYTGAETKTQRRRHRHGQTGSELAKQTRTLESVRGGGDCASVRLILNLGDRGLRHMTSKETKHKNFFSPYSRMLDQIF